MPPSNGSAARVACGRGWLSRKTVKDHSALKRSARVLHAGICRHPKNVPMNVEQTASNRRGEINIQTNRQTDRYRGLQTNSDRCFDNVIRTIVIRNFNIYTHCRLNIKSPVACLSHIILYPCGLDDNATVYFTRRFFDSPRR